MCEVVLPLKKGLYIINHTTIGGKGDQEEINDCIYLYLKCHNKEHGEEGCSLDVPFGPKEKEMKSGWTCLKLSNMVNFR